MAEGDAGGAGDKEPPRVQMRRVVPSYRRRIPLVLGVIQIVLGVLILVFGVVNISIKAFVSAGGTSFLAALAYITHVAGSLMLGLKISETIHKVSRLFACGGVAIVSSRNKEIWAISLYLLLSFIAVIFTVTLVAASGVGVLKETERSRPIHSDVREAVDLVLCVVAVMATVTLVISVVHCSMTLFYGCCKQTSGARYVTEPQVRFTPENISPDDTSSTTVGESGTNTPVDPNSTYTPGEGNPAVLPVI